MKWVTRNHVHVDRVACPWLIHRFIDQEAEFEFIPYPGPVPDSTEGILFDFPDLDIPFTHHDGKCTFEVLIDHYGLEDSVLLEMARVIHGADVVRDIDLIPESRGVELTLSGVSFLSDDDHQAIQRGFIICDSMYVGLLLRILRGQMKTELEGKAREEAFHLLHNELKQRLPPTIKVGSVI
jgi:hypothetical protein